MLRGGFISAGLKVAIAGSFITGSLIVGPFSTMKAICDGFSCAGFVYFAFASICFRIFCLSRAGIFKNVPKKSTRLVVDLFANAIFFKEKTYLDITNKYCFTHCWNR